jgi:hypothetical protein
MLKHVERDLLSLAHIPKSQPGFQDPRSLPKTELSELIQQRENVQPLESNLGDFISNGHRSGAARIYWCCAELVWIVLKGK